jgi:hypothetical protein
MAVRMGSRVAPHATPLEQPQTGGPAPARPATGPPTPADLLALVAVVVIAVWARRPGYLLSHSFWLDEAWVADSLRAPLGQLQELTASTPIGWSALLRLVPRIGSPERYRLVPLAFGIASVGPAWLAGRWLAPGWRGRAAGVLVALAVAVAPAALARHDLKQYTADALVVLVVLVLVGRAELDGRRPDPLAALVPLTLVGAAGILLSHVSVVAAAAGFGALGLRRLAERDWPRLAATAAAATATGLVQGIAYVRFTAPGNNDFLRRWWAEDFVPTGRGPAAAATFVAERLTVALERTGLGPWPLVLALAVTGVVVLWLAGRRAAAGFGPLVALGLVAAGVARLYPLLDARTSLFFTVLLTAYAAAGVVGLAALAASRPTGAVVAAAVLGAAALAVAPAAAEAGATPMPTANVREQVEYVLAHRRPGDVVVVNHGAQFGFAYYWPDRPSFLPTDSSTAVRFRIDYPGRRDLVVAHRKDPVVMAGAMDRALAARPGRIWVVLGFASRAGLAEWRAVAARAGAVRAPVPGWGLLEVRTGPGEREPSR